MNKLTKAVGVIVGLVVGAIISVSIPGFNLAFFIFIMLLLILLLCSEEKYKKFIQSIISLLLLVTLSVILLIFKIIIPQNYIPQNPELFVLYIYAVFSTLMILSDFKEEIIEIFDWNTTEILKLTFQNYLFILSIVASIAVALVLSHVGYLILNTTNSTISDFLMSNAKYVENDCGNFLTVGGILATISALLVSISWVIIQTSSDRLSNILMWIWVRDERFLTFVAFSFTTVFLLILISLTHVQLHVIDYGIIYYIIMLNFLMYGLYIKAFANVINPKYAVDLILRGRDRGDTSGGYGDLTDAESRLYAVYEIIKKRIEAKDVYAVVKCLNMINKNFDKYWMFIEDENREKYLKDFLDILNKLKAKYRKSCISSINWKNEPYSEKGLEAFKNLIDKCDEKLETIRNNPN
ncbi:hypothetical protein MFS40622_1471 [Methanocaldococcus sp. FS406-22]|uniref:hypothetical protein n=1 Tax=Methanocaldococcus sp. (strain FS406-22) TaxID=644281 RepID=UPI0001BF1E1E|nr:hypothetical protein [Methanocaldococcus sp. FS406-22]ADC70145.1 hypothetical protein MFS40622_1471 [Methanocaldococcus sp. FS406-22]